MELTLKKVLVSVVTVWFLLSCDYLTGVSCMVPSEAISHSPTPPPWSIQYPAEVPGEVWYEDEGWWDGAEEIDLTLPSDVNHEDEEYVLVDDFLSFNESFFADVECEDFSKMSSPPNFMDSLPPPPLPPFLMGIDEILRESTRRWNRRKAGDFDPSDYEYESELLTQKLKWVTFEDDKCSVCEWANGGNETISMLAKKQESNVILSNTMVGILVGVALISAAIGATVMGVMLKCRRIKILPCARGRNWLRSSAGRRVHSENTGADSTSSRDKTNPPGVQTTRSGLVMKLWRRGSSQAPLNPCSSPGSENSYSEEPYINADAISATYAELSNGTDSIVRLEPSPSLNTYAEIPNPVRSAELNLCSKLCGHEGTYENAGYMLSETHTDPNESSTGSNSTPSSAYYSDVSSCDIYTNKKKKKKRKGEERFSLQTSYPIIGSSLSSVGIPVICSHVAHKPVHLNLNAVQSQYVPSRDNVPVTLQLLPRQISFDQRGLDTVSTSIHHQGILQNPNLNQNMQRHNPRLHLSLRNHYDPNHINVISAQNLSACNNLREGHLQTHIEGHVQPHVDRQIHPLLEGHVQSHLDAHFQSHIDGHIQPHVDGHIVDGHVQSCIEGHIQSQLDTHNGVQSNMEDHNIPPHLLGHPQSVYDNHLDNQSQEAMLRQYNGNVVQRPLPPLPSRQMNDMRRKNFKVILENGIEEIPSDV